MNQYYSRTVYTAYAAVGLLSIQEKSQIYCSIPVIRVHLF